MFPDRSQQERRSGQRCAVAGKGGTACTRLGELLRAVAVGRARSLGAPDGGTEGDHQISCESQGFQDLGPLA